MSLTPIAENLWQLESWTKIALGVPFPVRMTVVRLGDGRLWLHSPLPIDDELAAELAQLGDVAFVVSPNRFHSLFATAAKERYPDAELWACPTLPDKRKKIPFDAEIDPTQESSWITDIDQLLVAGCPGMSEMVFFHRDSGTLIVTDLLMNMHEVRGWRMRFILWLAGTREKFIQSKFWKPLIKDREAAVGTVREILTWNPRRVVMCHGDPVDTDVDAQLRTAFRLFVLDPSELEDPVQSTGE